MSYSTQNLGSLMDDLGIEEDAGGKRTRGGKTKDGDTPIWKSQGAVAALAVLAVAVLCLGIWYSFFSGGAPKMPNRVMLLDVKTGELFVTNPRKHRLMLPAKNPNTGERVLFPVRKNDNGDWIVPEHYRSGVDNIEFSRSVILNLDTGRVRVTDEDAKRLQ